MRKIAVTRTRTAMARAAAPMVMGASTPTILNLKQWFFHISYQRIRRPNVRENAPTVKETTVVRVSRPILLVTDTLKLMY